jgi:hypothetical protein
MQDFMRTELAQLADLVPITPYKSTKEIATIYIGIPGLDLVALPIQEEARRTSISMLPDIKSQRARGDAGVLQKIQA